MTNRFYDALGWTCAIVIAILAVPFFIVAMLAIIIYQAIVPPKET